MKTFDGKVVKTAMQNTATVEVTRTNYHSLYGVRIVKSRKHKCDTTEVKVSVGDLVRIGEIKPMSKYKHFKIVKILSAKGEK